MKQRYLNESFQGDYKRRFQEDYKNLHRTVDTNKSQTIETLDRNISGIKR